MPLFDNYPNQWEYSNVQQVAQDGLIAQLLTHHVVLCFIHPYQGIVRRGTDR